jgi:glycosyltransferase involved in cell wall biosynthesis
LSTLIYTGKIHYYWKILLDQELMAGSYFNTLLIISPGFPRDENDTACLPAQQAFVKSLKRVSPDLRIIIVALQYPPHENEYRWFGHLVIPFNSTRYGRILRPLLWQRIFRRLDRIDLSGETRILSFWYMETALVGKRYGQRRNFRHYCWILGQDARRKNYYPKWLRLKPNRLIVLSDFLADEFTRNHRRTPAYTVPNGIDPSLFRNNGAIERSIDLLGVGSLIKLKQYQIFLTVIAHLKQSNPDIKAVLCGHGPEERRLAGQINELNLKDNVRLTGEIPHETVIEFMLQSKILVHPSSYEGYSAACLEALYAGCHVVSFVAGEKREIDHWHIVSSVGEMIERCHDLMLHEPDFNPHLVHHMDDVAQKVLNLLEGGGDVTTS